MGYKKLDTVRYIIYNTFGGVWRIVKIVTKKKFFSKETYDIYYIQERSPYSKNWLSIYKVKYEDIVCKEEIKQ